MQFRGPLRLKSGFDQYRLDTRKKVPNQNSPNDERNDNKGWEPCFEGVTVFGMLEGSLTSSLITLATQYRTWLFVGIGILSIVVARQLTVPKELAHLPIVPILPLLLSYATNEAENKRIQRLILPFAEEGGEGVVVVYALGRWIVHVLDAKMVQKVLENPGQFPKEVPPDGILLWRLVGYSNIILANGSQWKRHSQIVKAALNAPVPIDDFVNLSLRVFQKLGKGGSVMIDEFMVRFTLDAVGTTALGYDFDAINDDASPFVCEYGRIMEAIANPLYLIFPRLEKIFPRHEIIKQIDSLRSRFDTLMTAKKREPGNDMFSFMIEHPEMTNDECRDNMVVFFIAGHDTAAGSISSLIYYLAKNPELQQKARNEVNSVLISLGKKIPDLEALQQMPYLTACIREALRLNTPITYIVPRSTVKGFELRGTLKSYYIPPKVSLIMNLTAVHHNSTYYPDPEEFNPDRFLNFGGAESSLTWLPFASGPRQCPARNFAMYEMRTLVSMLLQRYEWKLPYVSPHEVRIQNGFSPFALSLPKDLQIEFTCLRRE